ncbi:CRISPR-associated endonuclease Cas3'' [Streptomyces marincola]|uniref:CRISPR-associated endonuclease Cas3'' n=1 Tax=Streptomyces marincola TaxID=2878388 RepID=UPI001CF2884E|nr:CRISPR-associated endonuclease Cas3'' [Streptomyces marincola]UCM87057.1 CRISPR-associated endonuclease Cas3'' [Streptomyces marincola]
MTGGVLYAHSANDAGVRHELADHLRGSATLARMFGNVFGAGDVAAYLALVHDVGKGWCCWQHRLISVENEQARGKKQRVGVPHKEAGAGLAAKYIARPFAALVLGHHGGLPDDGRVREVVRSLAGSGPDAVAAREAVAAVSAVVPEIIPPKPLRLPDWFDRLRGPHGALQLDLLERMLFSTLVDADFLDTAAHFSSSAVRVAPDADMAALYERFERRRADYLDARPPSAVDEVRADIYRQVLDAATRAPGMYVLHVPTGGGKTLASAGFALRHAAEHALQRVIVAVPYVSITEQNAQVYRKMLDPRDGEEGGPVVLEHHSSVDLDDEAGSAQWARLGAENWDAPMVVTTTVQLFQSIFAHRPSAMRKLHRLAGSVIVLDEVQALPDRLLAPILSVLRGLVDHFGASVVLASATQPEFWALPELRGSARLEMVEDVARLFEQLRRVEYSWLLDDGLTWEDVAGAIVAEPEQQVLTVVNTTVDAARLHRAVGRAVGADVDTGDGGVRVLHLSTRMTAEHRREVIADIRCRLALGQPTFVISTSLIEAGVDVDFPCVYRAMAPAESLQQAAGRCNRDGNLDTGRVVVFRPSEGGVPQDASYQVALDATVRFFGPNLRDPDDLAALRGYYEERYTARGSDGRPFGALIQEARRALDFPKVAAEFQMIDNDHTTPVVVIRPTKSEQERDAIARDIATLRSPYPCGPEVLRRLQPHTATLPRHEAQEAVRAGFAVPITGDLLEWRSHYDEARGLDRDEPEDHGAFLV